MTAADSGLQQAPHARSMRARVCVCVCVWVWGGGGGGVPAVFVIFIYEPSSGANTSFYYCAPEALSGESSPYPAGPMAVPEGLD